MTSTAHSQVVQKQFGEQASAYLSSAVHAQGAEFALLQAALAGRGDARVLDLGCGAGHVSFHVAPLAGEVVAYDLSQQMLDVVSTAAAERGLGNISTVRGAAERLPFADGEFDFVFSRYSAHHWSDLGLALREVRRVLKPGGVMAFIDILSPGTPLLDTTCKASKCCATPAMCAIIRPMSGCAKSARRGCTLAALRVSGCAWSTSPGSSACAPPR
jgi:ubiquinone/menaquinone biosynthesis C-methylase UbiE